MPSALFDAVSAFLRSATCGILNSADAIAAIFEGTGEGEPIPALDFGRFAAGLACGAPPPPGPTPPFTGGQCNCKLYNIQIKLRNIFPDGSDAGPGATIGGQTWGPVGGAVARREGSVTRLYLTSKGSPFDFPQCQGPSAERAIFDAGTRFKVDSQNYTPVSGPDNCGNPSTPRAPLPSGWNSDSGDVVVPTPGGGTVSVPISITLGFAYVSVNANIVVPIKIDLGGINLTANFDFSNDTINYGPPSGPIDRRPRTQPTDLEPEPGSPIPPAPPGLPPLPPGTPPIDTEPSETKTIFAALVTVSSFPDSVGTLIQGSNADIALPDFGNIAFLCRIGNGETAWTTELRVKNRRMLIPCPIESGAIVVGGTPRPGVNWTITPLYSRKNPPILFP